MATIGDLLFESCRLRTLRVLEENLGSAGYLRIAGVDEAGRGCLAGPVVAAAVIADPAAIVPGVDDSKKLTAEQRELLEPAIRRSCLASAVCLVSAETIDRINILQATCQAMSLALAGLDPGADFVLVDAVRLSGLSCPSMPVVKGDQVSYSIACASILAKVHRDRHMRALDRRYPQYGFASNKGYGAAAHRQALADYGPCPEHRLTFRSVLPRREGSAPAFSRKAGC